MAESKGEVRQMIDVEEMSTPLQEMKFSEKWAILV